MQLWGSHLSCAGRLGGRAARGGRSLTLPGTASVWVSAGLAHCLCAAAGLHSSCASRLGGRAARGGRLLILLGTQIIVGNISEVLIPYVMQWLKERQEALENHDK